MRTQTDPGGWPSGRPRSVAVLLPSYNGRNLLEQNLPAVLAAADEAGATVRVADDASSDDTFAWLSRAFPTVEVVRSDRRLGFGGTCNLGLSGLEVDVVVLLNTDVQVSRKFLQPLLGRFDGSRGPFAVSPAIRRGARPDDDEAVNHFAFVQGLIRPVFPCIGGAPPPRDLQPIGYGVGAAVAMDRRRLAALGGFDPLFAPFYCEDSDLGFRAWRRGWPTFYEPASRVVHAYQSTVARVAAPTTVRTIHFRNELLWNWKNLHDRALWLRHLAWLLRYPASFLRHRLGPEARGYAWALWRVGAALRRREGGRAILTDREIFLRARPSGVLP